MAKLHITIGPPLPDPSSFQNHTSSLNDEEKTVHSLRGFACVASMLLPAYHLFFAAIEVGEKIAARRGYPSLILQIFLSESMLNQLLVQIRRLYDPNPGSLGGGLLASLLAQPEIRSLMIKRASDRDCKTSIDSAWAESHLRFVQARCSLQLVNHVQNLPADAPMTQVQAHLARRAANKRAAHMTLDDYGVTLSDIKDLVFNAMLIARAIQRVMGDDTYTGNYEEVDRGAYEAAAQVFGHRHSNGLLLVDLEANVDLYRSKPS